MSGNRSLAQRLRLEAISDDAREMLAEVIARLVNNFWAKSRHIDFRPSFVGLGFDLLIHGKKVARITYGGMDGGCMKPCVVVTHIKDEAGFTSADEAEEALIQIIEEEFTTTGANTEGKTQEKPKCPDTK